MAGHYYADKSKTIYTAEAWVNNSAVGTLYVYRYGNTATTITELKIAGDSACKPVTETPTISPAGGVCSFPKTVTISCGTDGATVYYTTDGSDPADSTTKHSYTASFTIDGPCTVKAYAVAEDMDDSSAATVAYTDATVGEGVTAHVVNGVCTISGLGAITDTSTLKGLGVTNLIIESGVTGIGDYAFKYWTSLRNVSVAETCINVGVESFHKCANVTNMSFAASSAINVGNYAFLRCPSLQKLSFSSMPSFGTSSFAFSTAIFMTNGVPELYTIPVIEITDYAQVLRASSDLQNWIDAVNDDDKSTNRFFKIELRSTSSNIGGDIQGDPGGAAE